MGIPRRSHAQYLLTSKWRYKKGELLLKRGPRCEICRSISGSPEVHHLHYGSLGYEREEDLQIVCDNCHEWEHWLRPKWSFNSVKSFRKYLSTLSSEDLNRRFPYFWIAPELRKERPVRAPEKPSVVATISSDGKTFTAAPRPKIDPDLFAVLSASGFRCEYCSKPLRSNNFHVSGGKASCGCDMAAAFFLKKQQESSLRDLTAS